MPRDTSGFNGNPDDDLFGGLEPFELPHLESGGNTASGSGSRTLIDGLEVPGDAEFVKMDWDNEERQDMLIPELIRHWTNERLAPDILDQRGELVQKVLERVREQVGWRLTTSFVS